MKLRTLGPNATTHDVLAELDYAGAVIVKDVIGEETLDRFNSEVMPYVERTPMGSDNFAGKATKRTGALAARSQTCRDLILHELALGAAEAFLAPFTKKVLLHLTQTIEIHPGGRAQAIHRDRYAWGDYLPQSIEPQLNTIWAITDFTTENGATNCAPGSHRWSWEQQARPDQICQAEMSKGSVLFYTGSILHHGGANMANAPRLGLNLTYCLGWLRQEENQYLSCPPDLAQDFDPRLQELLGYTQGEYSLGYYSDPLEESGSKEILPPDLMLGRIPIKQEELTDLV